MTTGGSVIVSRNEVAWARNHPGECVLGISFDEDGDLDTSNTTFRVFRWEADDYELEARRFDWYPSGRKQIFRAQILDDS